MRLTSIFLTCIIALGFVGNIAAQDLKIGYANIEAILVYMPETKTMNQTLQSFEQKLGEDINNRRQYAQTLLQEYQEYIATLDPNNLTADQETEVQNKQKKLQELDAEIQKKTTDSQQKLMEKRQTLLNPIISKIQDAISKLATEEGYDFIINSMDGSGVSIVLHGPKEHDVTRKLMGKLGIQIPEADQR